MGQYYQYWFCLGHQRREGCDQGFMPNDEVEAAIERYYEERITLDESRLVQIRQTLLQAFQGEYQQAERIRTRTQRRLATVERDRHKLLQALYADAVPMELFKSEQERFSTEERRLKMHLEAIEADFDVIKTNLERALEFAQNAATAYAGSSPAMRRRWNQLLFTHLYVDDSEVVRAELTPPFAALLADDLLSRLDAELRDEPRNRRGAKHALSLAESSSKSYLVETMGLEPTTPCLQSRCSSQLSYVPWIRRSA
jgi:site-specific DNA recombinase